MFRYSQNAFTKPRRRPSQAVKYVAVGLALVLATWAGSGALRGATEAEREYPPNPEMGVGR